jgi:glutaconate CoA-transferase subunit A
MAGKLIALGELGRFVQSGMTVGIGGGPLLAAPMALVREVVRSGARDLHLVASSTGGIALDLLIGAGCAASAEFAQIVLNEHGPAPNFRRWAEAGRLACRDHS